MASLELRLVSIHRDPLVLASEVLGFKLCTNPSGKEKYFQSMEILVKREIC